MHFTSSEEFDRGLSLQKADSSGEREGILAGNRRTRAIGKIRRGLPGGYPELR